MATRTLNVELISASGLKDTEFIGKSDPYVVMSIGKTTHKSAVAKDQPSSPAWNEKFTMPVAETDVELLVRVLNDDTMGRDEEMGRTVVPLSFIHGGSHSESTFPLELKGKSQGEIKLCISFEGEESHGHRGHSSESHEGGLVEKVQGLFVGDKDHDDEEGHGHHKGHHDGDGEGDSLKEKLEDKVEDVKKGRKHKKEKKLRGSGDEGGSSSSSESESEKDD